MANLEQNPQFRNLNAEVKAKTRLNNGENVVRQWRFDNFYMVAHWREAECLAAAIKAAVRRVWLIPSAELESVVPRLVRARALSFTFSNIPALAPSTPRPALIGGALYTAINRHEVCPKTQIFLKKVAKKLA